MSKMQLFNTINSRQQLSIIYCLNNNMSVLHVHFGELAHGGKKHYIKDPKSRLHTTGGLCIGALYSERSQIVSTSHLLL